MSVCLNCNAELKANTSSIIHCDVCQGPLHLKCVGLSETDAKLTRAKSRAIKVVCNSCGVNMSQFKDIKHLITTIQNELTASINNLKSEFDLQLNDLRAALAAKQQHVSFEFEDVVNEVTERQNRKSNLIIFGVEEVPEDGDRDVVTLQDSIQTRAILEYVLPDYRSEELHVQRLGRRSRNRNRPIKISLRNGQEVSNFLRHAKKLRNSDNYNNVFISSDKTPRQIQFYKQVKEELNDRKRNGETNLKIRHFNGVPKIVNGNLN